MCVLMMATRQLALLNKTGQVDFEINSVCKLYTEWIRSIIHVHFNSFFGGNLFLSYDRVIAGFTSRQVATTFLATCARQICECGSMTDANTMTLMDMETAPLTLHSCNLAICNALTHLVDTNLIMVNQIIRDKLNTPVLPPMFLLSIFGESQLDTEQAKQCGICFRVRVSAEARDDGGLYIKGGVPGIVFRGGKEQLLHVHDSGSRMHCQDV